MSQPVKISDAKLLFEWLNTVGSVEGRAFLADYPKTLPLPHYEPAPDSPGLLVRIEENGKRTVGRFVNRTFKTSKRPKR